MGGSGSDEEGPSAEELAALLHALEAARDGDLGVRLGARVASPRMAEIAAAFDALVETAASTTGECARALDATARGELGAKVALPGVSGAWGELAAATDAATTRVASHLRNLSEVTRAIARGDLSARMNVAVEGEMAALDEMINAMIDQLTVLASEVARLADEVGQPVPRTVPAATRAGIWRDLTDQLTIAERLALVARYKSELLATVGHEIRTPLNSLLILAKTLSENREANLTARQVEYARTIHLSGRNLLTILNDVLDLSKAEAGQLRVHRRSVALAERIADLERIFRPVAEQKGLALVVELEPSTPEHIVTDPERLQQILTNLLSNAIKFTAEGHVALVVSMAKGEPRVVTFTVRDTGIGIPREKQELIFEAFHQAEETTYESYGGTGLGLSISRQLARLLGGSIRVESEPGRGSAFTLELLAKEAISPQPAPAAPVVAETTELDVPALDPVLVGRTVLLVGGDMRAMFAAASVLESRGVSVLHAAAAEEAIEALARAPVVDAVVAEMGDRSSDALREACEARRIPLIALGADHARGPGEPPLLASLVSALGG